MHLVSDSLQNGIRDQHQYGPLETSSGQSLLQLLKDKFLHLKPKADDESRHLVLSDMDVTKLKYAAAPFAGAEDEQYAWSKMVQAILPFGLIIHQLDLGGAKPQWCISIEYSEKARRKAA